MESNFTVSLTPISVPKYVTATFIPKEDITAFELAQIIPIFFSNSLTEEQWDKLGVTQRHFKRI